MSAIQLPEDVAAALAAAAAERGVSIDQLAAETLAARFGPNRHVFSFAASGSAEVERRGAHAEDLLDEGGFDVDSAGFSTRQVRVGTIETPCIVDDQIDGHVVQILGIAADGGGPRISVLIWDRAASGSWRRRIRTGRSRPGRRAG